MSFPTTIPTFLVIFCSPAYCFLSPFVLHVENLTFRFAGGLGCGVSLGPAGARASAGHQGKRGVGAESPFAATELLFGLGQVNLYHVSRTNGYCLFVAIMLTPFFT